MQIKMIYTQARKNPTYYTQSKAKEICLKKLKNRESRHKAKLKYNQNDEILKELNSLNIRKLILSLFSVDKIKLSTLSKKLLF